MTEDGQFPGMGDSQRKIKNDPYLIGTPWRWNLAGGRGRSWARGRRSRSSGGANIWGRLSRTRPCRRTRGTCRDTSQSCSRHGTSTRRRWCADFPTFLASIPGKSKSARQGPPPLSRPEPEAQASRGEEFHSRPGRSRGGWCKWSRSRGPRASSRCRDPLWKAATKRIKSWTFLLWRRNAVFISFRFVRRDGSFGRKNHTNWKIMRKIFAPQTWVESLIVTIFMSWALPPIYLYSLIFDRLTSVTGLAELLPLWQNFKSLLLFLEGF